MSTNLLFEVEVILFVPVVAINHLTVVTVDLAAVWLWHHQPFLDRFLVGGDFFNLAMSMSDDVFCWPKVAAG